MSATSKCSEIALRPKISSSESESVLLALKCYSLFLLLSTGARFLGIINWLFLVISERALSVMSETTTKRNYC